VSEIVPQSIDSYLEQLIDEDPKLRYEAIHWLALKTLGDRFNECYDAVWARTEDNHPRVHWAAGIAASMMSARHSPYSMFNTALDMPYEINSLSANVPKDNAGIPDFIPEWDDE